MPQIRPPFAELNFYWRDQSNFDSFHNLLTYLLANGAEMDGPIEEGPAVVRYKALMRHATGTTGRSETVTNLRIRSESARNDRHPIAIWTEGDIFCGPDDDKKRRTTARRTGNILRKKFLQIVSALRPDYAAITSEEGLECLDDLKAHRSSSAFGDFYLRRDFVTPRKLTRILERCSECYREDLEEGTYISSYAPFNPRHVSVQDHYISSDIANILAERH